MRRGYSFRPRGWILALAAAACAAFVALGDWQSRRADEKVALARERDAAVQQPPLAIDTAPLEPENVVNRHVVALGTFASEATVFLGRNRDGRPGYEVVTPLMLSPSLAVLVRRGWIEGARLAEVRIPTGQQRIDGIAIEHLPRAFSAGDARGPIRQNLEIDDYAREISLALQPIVIDQRNDNGDGLSRAWPAPDVGSDRNRAYALQWYAFAGLAAVLGIVFSFRRVA